MLHAIARKINTPEQLSTISAAEYQTVVEEAVAEKAVIEETVVEEAVAEELIAEKRPGQPSSGPGLVQNICLTTSLPVILFPCLSPDSLRLSYDSRLRQLHVRPLPVSNSSLNDDDASERRDHHKAAGQWSVLERI